MIDSIKPGQTVKCTILKEPLTTDDKQTVMRLMRKDPAIQRRLRRSQMMRRRNMVVYNRGNRDWYKRDLVGKIAVVKAGSTWEFTYTLELGRDMKVVERFLKVEAA
jgi:hypothetical protein